MATLNPLERRAKTSFIKGILVAGLIGLLVALCLGMVIYKKDQAEKERLGRLVSVAVLTQDVKSGAPIEGDMIKTIKVDPDTVPSSATSDISKLTSAVITDENGNVITAYDSNGTYRVDNEGVPIYTMTFKDTNQEVELTPKVDTSNITTTTTTTTTTTINGTSNTNTNTNTTNNQSASADAKKRATEFTYKDSNGAEQTVKIGSSTLVAKVDLGKNTILTPGMYTAQSNKSEDDTRKVEFNVISLPSDLQQDESIDIRLRLPDGKDFIIISKKNASFPDQGTPSDNQIYLNLSESEISLMSSAIVESYEIQGSKLYATKYTDPGLQKEATPTYVPSQEIVQLIVKDPNIVDRAKTELYNRFQDNSVINVRSTIQGQIDKSEEEERRSQVQSGTQTEVQTQTQDRKSYLSALNGNED